MWDVHAIRKDILDTEVARGVARAAVDIILTSIGPGITSERHSERESDALECTALQSTGGDIAVSAHIHLIFRIIRL